MMRGYPSPAPQTEGNLVKMNSQNPQSQDHDAQITTLQSDPQVAAVTPPEKSRNLAQPGGETAGKWSVMVIVAIGVFMATLDSSIVNISLPAVARAFGVPLNGLVEWVIIAYLVTTTAVLLTAGRLADMIGRKAVWIAGLILFTGSSALCGLAPSLLFLVSARALQGIGGALLMAISPAMLTTAFPAYERGKALGINAINVALGVSVGPVLGGIITSTLSWRWIFYVNVPVGIIGLILTLRILKERLHRNPGRFDPMGALLLAIGLAGITAVLSFGQEMGWTSPFTLIILPIGIIALVLLPFVEQRVANPIILFSLLRNRVFASSILSQMLSFVALFAVSFMMPFYFEELRNFPTEMAGFLLTPLPLTIAIVAPISGALSDRFGSRWLAASGLTIACIGLVLLGQLNEHSSIFDIVWRLVVTSVGQGLFQSPNNSALLGSAPREHQGSASGFLATGRTMGQSISVALAGAIFTGLGGASAGVMIAHAQGAQLAALQQTFNTSIRATFITCAMVAAIGIFASLVRGKEEKKA
jgi:EmrB/QacA subfamily drug resistance transporter